MNIILFIPVEMIFLASILLEHQNF